MSSDKEYVDMYKHIDIPRRVEFDDLAGTSGAILQRIKPIYFTEQGSEVFQAGRPWRKADRFWRKFLSSLDRAVYPDRSAERFLPVEVTLKERIEFLGSPRFTFNVSVSARVLLYRFGWSTCISLLLTGTHTITNLVEFTRAVMTQKIFKIDQSQPCSLRDIFDSVAQGVRMDAFGKGKTEDVDTQEIMSVVTVLGKHGGSPAPKGLSNTEKIEMVRLVQPDKPVPTAEFDSHTYQKQGELDYIIHHDVGRFIWLESLLVPKGRNEANLNCYHNNSFYTLLQAWHLEGLLRCLMDMKRPPKEIRELLHGVRDQLRSPSFKNASLFEYLRRNELQDIIARAEQFKEKDRSA
jgi:hypothetical protein